MVALQIALSVTNERPFISNSFPGDELQALWLKLMEDGNGGLKNTKTRSNRRFLQQKKRKKKKENKTLLSRLRDSFYHLQRNKDYSFRNGDQTILHHMF